MTFLSLRCSTTSPVTLAPETSGLPWVIFSPSRVKEHVTESHLLARIALEQIHVDRVAFCDAILSAACFDNCVSHGLGKSRQKSHGPVSLTSGNPRFSRMRRRRAWWGETGWSVPPIDVGACVDGFAPGLSLSYARHQERDLALGRMRLIVGQ